MRYFQATNQEYILNDDSFYFAELTNQVHLPIENDHFFKWISVEKLEGHLVHDHHIWAVQEGYRQKVDFGRK
jgi:8-oxo-dGTP diphosphatase